MSDASDETSTVWKTLIVWALGKEPSGLGAKRLEVRKFVPENAEVGSTGLKPVPDVTYIVPALAVQPLGGLTTAVFNSKSALKMLNG
jgi:hypothetical protein